MGLCFLCDTKMYGERTKVCSSITPHSMVPYPEKIAELMGEEFVIIVTPSDHMCKKCTTLFTHMDKCECDLKIVKNSILSSIQKKYGILPPDHAVKNVVIVNGNVKVEEQIEQGQREVSSGPTLGVAPTMTTAAVPLQTSFKLLKTQQFQPQQQQLQQKQPQQQQLQQKQPQQQQPQQKQPQQQQPQQKQPQQQQPQQQQLQQKQPQLQQPQQQQLQQQLPQAQLKCNNKPKIYKCGFCNFQSKDLGNVRFHMRAIHSNKAKEPEKPIPEQAAAIALTPVPQPKRRVYRCQVCSKSFDVRENCLDHIQKDHNKLSLSTSNGVKGTDGSRQVTSKFINQEPSKAQENNQQADDSMDVDENKPDNKGTVDTDMMLNENVPTEGSADAEQEETENADEGEVPKTSHEDNTVKVFKLIKKTKPAQDDATEEKDKEDGAEEEKYDAAEEEDKEDAAAAYEDKEEAAEEDAAEEDEAGNTVVSEQEEADQDSVEKEVEKDVENVENKPEDLDIESMLAAIHNDDPPTNNSVDTQNKA